MGRIELVSFIRQRGLAVLATTIADGDFTQPGSGRRDRRCGDRFFDTVTSSRKYANLTWNRRVALVGGVG